MLMADQLEQGVDLFNQGKFFEAHEVWEDLWRETSGPHRICIQGLIQAAVGLYHRSKGNFIGARSQLGKAIRNLGACQENSTGWDIPDLVRQLASAGDGLDRSAPSPQIRRK
jgi:predicted metal-dependent hydrolase